MTDAEGQPIARINTRHRRKGGEDTPRQPVVTSGATTLRASARRRRPRIFAFIINFQDYVPLPSTIMGIQRKQDWDKPRICSQKPLCRLTVNS
jgi:hypothetical protein